MKTLSKYSYVHDLLLERKKVIDIFFLISSYYNRYQGYFREIKTTKLVYDILKFDFTNICIKIFCFIIFLLINVLTF